MKYAALICGIILATTVTFAKDIHVAKQTSMRVYGNEDDNTPHQDKAEVVIKAPDKVKVGDLIVIDLSESLGGGFDYVIEPLPPGLRTFDGGKIIVCGTGSKNLVYKLMVSCALKGDSDISVQEIKVTGGVQPGPPPDPGQDLVEKVQDWADEVDYPEKRDDAIKLSQSFASVASVIEQGSFGTIKELLQATKISNRDALENNLDNWTPFLDSLYIELEAMSSTGLLTQIDDHARVWRDVSEGLKKHAETL